MALSRHAKDMMKKDIIKILQVSPGVSMTVGTVRKKLTQNGWLKSLDTPCVHRVVNQMVTEGDVVKTKKGRRMFVRIALKHVR